MDFTLDLPIYESILDEFMGRAEFKKHCYELRQLEEMCMDTDELQQYYDEHYLSEALDDIQQSTVQNIKNGLKATRDTTKGMVKAHSALTSSLGNAMSTSYNLVYKLVMAIVKVMSFLFNAFAALPKALLKLTNAVGNIPGDVLTKINGDIQLYITAEDIATIYNESILRKVSNFLATAELMTHGEMFGSKHHMTGHDGRTGEKIKASENDKKLALKLRGQYRGLEGISFNKTMIKLNDPVKRNIYFSTDQGLIKFRDLSGNEQSGTYYSALKKLLQDMEAQEDKLKAVHKAIGEKYDKAHMNQTWGAMDGATQILVSDSIQYISKVITLMGNLTRYVKIDMGTMDNAISKILAASQKKK